MNDRIRFLIAAVTGLSLATAILIGWLLTRDDRRKEFEVIGGPANDTGRGNMAMRTSTAARHAATGSKSRVGTASGPATARQIEPASNGTLPKADEQPEVKEAREALVAAQKRAADAMEKAMNQNYGGISFDAFQKVQQMPEGQKAREETTEAERKYQEAN